MLTFGSGALVEALSTPEQDQTATLLSSMAVTNLVLLAPLLAIARRFTLPPGSVTVVYVLVAGLAAAVTGFDDGNLALLAGFLASGIAIDLLLASWLKPGPDRRLAFHLFATVTPLLTWTFFIATGFLTAPEPRLLDLSMAAPEPVIELYTGAPIVQAMIGYGLARIVR